jgi:hypothetical protein
LASLGDWDSLLPKAPPRKKDQAAGLNLDEWTKNRNASSASFA